MSESRAQIELPNGWQLVTLTVHYEGEDLRDDPNPFAANVMAQLRLDLEPNANLEGVVERDIENARVTSDTFEVINKQIKGSTAEVEWNASSGPQTVRQLVIYQNLGGSIYMLMGTHVAERFEAVRDDIKKIATRLLRLTR